MAEISVLVHGHRDVGFLHSQLRITQIWQRGTISGVMKQDEGLQLVKYSINIGRLNIHNYADYFDFSGQLVRLFART